MTVVALAGCGGDSSSLPGLTTETQAMAPVPSIDELEAGLGQESLPEDVRCRKIGERDFVCRIRFSAKRIETKRVHIAPDGAVITRP